MLNRRSYPLYIGVLLWAALFTYFNSIPHFADDPGLGWHLETGKWIVQNQTVPTTDPFLYSPKPREWISDQWLSDIIIFVLHELGGWSLLYFLFLFALLYLYFYLLLPVAVQVSGSLLSSLISLVLVYRLVHIHFLLRPTFLGFSCFVLLYCLIFIFDREPEKRSQQVRFIFLCSLLFLVWANLHPSFVLGLLLLSIYCITQFLVSLRRAVIAGVTLLVSCASTLINPYFIKLHKSIYELGTSNYFMNLNEEWQPLTLLSSEGETTLILCLLIFLAFLYSRNEMLKIKLFYYLAPAIFLLFSIEKVRILPYFGVLALIPAALSIKALINIKLFTTYRSFSKLREMICRVDLHFLPQRYFMTSVIVIASLIVFANDNYGPSQANYPHTIAQHLNKDASQKIVLASPNLGGFITRYIHNSQAIIDDRNTLLGEEFYESFFKSFINQNTFDSYLEEHSVTHVILSSSGSANRFFSEKQLGVKHMAHGQWVLYEVQ